MQEREFDVKMTLSFTKQTMREVAALENYIYEGLHDKEWGCPHIFVEATLTGERQKVAKKHVSKEELLELEKKGGKK